MTINDLTATAEGRLFRDSTGRDCQVAERSQCTLGGGVARVLVFHSLSGFRCVRHFPSNWRFLNAPALEALSWQT